LPGLKTEVDALRRRDTYAQLGGARTGRSVMIGLVDFQGLSLAELFNGVGHAPAPLSDEEHATLANAKAVAQSDIWNMPDWCADLLQSSHGASAYQIAQSLGSRAPVDLRVNLKRTSRDEAMDALAADEIATKPVEISESGLRVLENPRKVKMSQAYLSGLVELQDAGSQALIDVLPLSSCETILDYCAGGGGKSLAMAAACDAEIYAHDISDARMKDIPTRAARAGVEIECLTPEKLKQTSKFDMVLCDAPCSGSGAWRRSPDAKWRLIHDRFSELLALQSEILTDASKLVGEGGYFAYATCSLFEPENEMQVDAFLKNNPRFSLVTRKSWTPLSGCDGFFVALMRA